MIGQQKCKHMAFKYILQTYVSSYKLLLLVTR